MKYLLLILSLFAISFGDNFNVSVIDPYSAISYDIDGVQNPSLTLTRGTTYYFLLNSSVALDYSNLTHPFWIKNATVTGTGNAFSTGVSFNGETEGNVTFNVPSDAPDTLYYICQYHSSMTGTLNIVYPPTTGTTGQFTTGRFTTGQATTATTGAQATTGAVSTTGIPATTATTATTGTTGTTGTSGTTGIPATSGQVSTTFALATSGMSQATSGSGSTTESSGINSGSGNSANVITAVGNSLSSAGTLSGGIIAAIIIPIAVVAFIVILGILEYNRRRSLKQNPDAEKGAVEMSPKGKGAVAGAAVAAGAQGSSSEESSEDSSEESSESSEESKSGSKSGSKDESESDSKKSESGSGSEESK